VKNEDSIIAGRSRKQQTAQCRSKRQSEHDVRSEEPEIEEQEQHHHYCCHHNYKSSKLKELSSKS
jgi:hypothetical protein